MPETRNPKPMDTQSLLAPLTSDPPERFYYFAYGSCMCPVALI